MIGCGNDCPYCPQEKLSAAYGKDETRSLNEKTFDLLLDHLNPKTTMIHFSGFSEIFLHPQGHEFIAQAYERTFDIMLCTTLAGISENKISYLIDRSVWFEWIRLHEFDGFAFNRSSFERFGNLLLAAKLTANFSSSRVLQPISRGGSLWDPGFYAGPVTCNRFECNVALPDGRVCLCCSDWSLRHVLGNLFTHEYDGSAFEMARKLIREAAGTPNTNVLCKTCEIAIRR